MTNATTTEQAHQCIIRGCSTFFVGEEFICDEHIEEFAQSAPDSHQCIIRGCSIFFVGEEVICDEHIEEFGS